MGFTFCGASNEAMWKKKKDGSENPITVDNVEQSSIDLFELNDRLDQLDQNDGNIFGRFFDKFFETGSSSSVPDCSSSYSSDYDGVDAFFDGIGLGPIMPAGGGFAGPNPI